MKTVKFWEAMKAYEDNKKIRCESWSHEYYISKKENTIASSVIHLNQINELWQILEEPDTSQYLYQWMCVDRSANMKWMVYDFFLTEKEANKTFSYGHQKYSDQAWIIENGKPVKVERGK